MPATTRRLRQRQRSQGQRRQPKRTVICRDALGWLESQQGLSAIVTSIPDASEVDLHGDAYETFFRRAAGLCLASVADTGYAIFLQTDRKQNGWLSKAYWISDEATKAGMRMIWHKIALRTDVGKSDLFRPTYSHMLCFSRAGKVGPLLPDVVYRGSVTYDNAFGAAAVEFVLRYLKAQGVRDVVDPFVGSGTTLAIANSLGLAATGVDIDPEQCRKARRLML